MNAHIRDASPEDAAAIASVAQEVWPEEPLDTDAIRRLISESERATAVAELDGRIVGFVDGFMTGTAEGDARWEVDLLAVGPSAQGHGIGRALVRASVAAGAAAGAVTVRALIRIGNVASERVFAACGFAPDDGASRLWIAGNLIPPAGDAGMHVVRVRTFRYEGVWLEALTCAAIAGLLLDDSAGMAGAVISIDDRELSAAAMSRGLRPDGEFRFWSQIPRSSAG